ncbi:MAG: hypothetical protein OEZ39_20445 [Gammaproteobacteria bacterium]|nr:hypothetical protein [Gammaproteobacteria bacterium]
MNLEIAIQELREEGFVEGELSIDPLWYIIWEPENLEEYNKDYKLAEYLPGYIAFGSNGGNELLVVDGSGTVYTVPAIGMELRYANKIAESISDLKQYMEKNT